MTEPHKIRWYVLTGRRAGEAERLYDGPDGALATAAQRAALASRRFGSVQLSSGWAYGPPERNDLCQCRNAPARQILCSYGHMTECHYPLECEAAACRHLIEYGQTHDHASLAGTSAGERFAAWLGQAVRPDDVEFHDSPQEGEPGCLCSRCAKRIPADLYAVRCFDALRRTERRYHPACLGIPP